MNAAIPNPKAAFSAATAHVDEAAVKPLPNSCKVYVTGSRADIQVPMREISQSDTPATLGAEGLSHPAACAAGTPSEVGKGKGNME